MIIAKINVRGTNEKDVIVAVNLEHIKKDIAHRLQDFESESLKEVVSPDEMNKIKMLDGFATAILVIKTIERGAKGKEIPYQPGRTVLPIGYITAEETTTSNAA